MPVRNQPATRHAQFSGLNDAAPAAQIGFTALAKADNVDIDDELHVRRRRGYAAAVSLPIDAAWGDGHEIYFISSGSLYRYDANQEENLGTAPSTTGHLHGVRYPYGVALTTGFDMRVVSPTGVVRSFGVKDPTSFDYSVTPGGGALRAGLYQLAVVAFEPGIGESGTSFMQLVQTQASSAISVTLPSSPHSELRLYATATDGTELYLVGKGAPGAVVTYTGLETRAQQLALSSFGHGTPPEAARTIALHNGRLLYAVDSVLWYSESFAFERFNLFAGYIPFESDINTIVPTRGGVFVGTQKQHTFIGGDNIVQPTSVDTVLSYGATYTQPTVLEENQHSFEGIQGRAYLWTTVEGVVAGFDNGAITNLTRGTVVMPPGLTSTMAVRSDDDLDTAVFITRY